MWPLVVMALFTLALWLPVFRMKGYGNAALGDRIDMLVIYVGAIIARLVVTLVLWLVFFAVAFFV